MRGGAAARGRGRFPGNTADAARAANVDYVGVAAAKFEILSLLYASFRSRHLSRTRRAARLSAASSRCRAKRCGCTRSTTRSMRICGCKGRSTGAGRAGRRTIAIRRRRSSSASRASARRTSNTSSYLQWLAAEQLREAQASARELGMAIGLYGDVAVGANSAGSETWSNRRLYRQGASVGAPPDALALKGQDWGIPPQDPNELRDAAIPAVRRPDPQQHALRCSAAARSRDVAVPLVVGAARAALERRHVRALSAGGPDRDHGAGKRAQSSAS